MARARLYALGGFFVRLLVTKVCLADRTIRNSAARQFLALVNADLQMITLFGGTLY